MNKIYQHILLAGLLLLAVVQGSMAQSSPNCATASDDNVLTGRAFFNFGSVSNSFNTKNRANVTVGQPVAGSYFGQSKKGTYGFWSRFLLPPGGPKVQASEGDQEDRVQIDWYPDPLSPAATAYKIYRNGSLLASVDGETFSFLDFNVIAGKFYTYEVSGTNTFGEGDRGKALGFLNPNGVVTGQVKSLGGNPVPGTIVTLTPTIGTAGSFDGDDMAFAEYSPNFPRSQFTLSCWVRLGDSNDNTAIFDLGSAISKNWWLHTLPAAAGKGVRFGMGNGPGDVTELDYAFPAVSADDWHYIAATYNGSSLLLYADGELIQTAVANIAVDSMTLFLGQKASGLGFYKGKLDELRFYNRQLSQTEIQMFMSRTVAPDAAGLVNYWKFDEGVGSKTFDLTASKQKVYFCGPTWTTDKPNVLNAGLTSENGFYEIPGVNYGAGTSFTARPYKNFYFNQSLEFNAANNQYADLTDFDLTDSSTVEISLKAFDFSGDQCLLTKQNGGTDYFGLHLQAGNLMLQMGSSTQNLGALGMGFHRLAFVIEQPGGGSSATVKYYKDGTFVGSYDFSGVEADMKGGSPWTLGARRNGANLENYFSGLIDEVVVYNALVSLADLQAAANVGTSITRDDLKNYFPLNEGSGTKLKDYGSELTGDGTIRGATYSTVTAIVEEEPHKFSPSSRLVSLNPSNTSVDQVDFTDQSTVPVSGYIRFEGTTCFQKGVEILVNGEHASPLCFTDSTGYFSLDLEPGATVQIRPVFKQHNFYPAFWDIENIASPVAGILFRNQVKRSISGQMAGNAKCRKSVIPDGAIVKVKVETLDGCYYKEVQLTESNGKFKFNNLPPLKFTVAVTEHSNNVIYNYFQLKGGFTVDLTDVNDTTDFIYYAPPQVEISPLDTNACGITMLEQDGKYTTNIRVFQQYDGGVCYLDTAELHIDNLIEGDGPIDTLMTGGKFKYRFTAGFPNITSPYQKTLTILAKANELENTFSTQAVVLGKRPRLVNFTSTSPQLPMMILRDPPGDGSSASIEKGSTVCTGWSVDASASVKTSIGLELDLGNKQQIITGTPGAGKITEIGLDNSLELGMSVKTGLAVNRSAEVCMTATEKISTSGDGVIFGEDADVFVGGALNLLFGITDDLRWDTANCSFFIKPALLVFPDKFATTFLYSGYQIKKVVIPNLEAVGDTTSAKQWRAILQRNRDLKAAAVFEKNLSFDAGVSYENSSAVENTSETKFGFDVEIEASIAGSIGFKIDGTGAAVKMGMEMSMGVSTEFSSKETRTQAVSYTLADDDIKDVFTVDVLQDRVYSTPVFKTVSGNSSCPYEEKTVPRDGVDLTVDKTIIANVPMNDRATFKFNIGNNSQTDEYRTYFFELYNATNPNGAIVKVQGAGASGSFGMYAGQSQEVIVTIERGPTAFDYENLTFHVYSACEGSRYDALGNGDFPPEPFYKAINVSVHYLEPCSMIDIGFPLENWVFTPADGSTMFITLNEFDRNDPDLDLIRVQYRRKQGDGAWINIVEVPKGELNNDVFKIVEWNNFGLQDGEYEIRAVSECIGGQNAGISHVITGRFERHPPVILGTPQPSDGVLSLGDEISITFNELIRCDRIIQADVFSNNNIGLYDSETGNLIDATISCSGDKIVIVPKVPNRFIENKVLRVQVNNIQDLAGNNFAEKKWEFFVNRNPIRWLDGAVEVVKYEEDFVSLTRKIENTGGQATDYEILDVPSWVRVFPKKGTLAPGVAQPITFEFDSTMAFGAYLDTLFLDVVEGKEPVIVDARVVCHEPAWAVNPRSYDYSMNMTLQLDIEGVFSADRQDIVGAFINGECRGLAKMKYEPTLKKWLAFLTVYSSNFTGDSIKLQIWDASACLLYGSVLEKFTFESEDLVGSPLTPMTIRTNNLLLRKIEINEGWNWISFNLEFPDPSINAALTNLRRPQNDFIKGQTLFSQYFNAGNQWVGSLTTLGNTGMYQYRADAVDTLDMLGRPINLAATTIPVNVGWNWIGYLPQSPLPLNLALASLSPLNGDVIKSQTGFAQYVAGYGWLGNLQYMEAPEGYLLKISNAGTLAYPVPSNLTEVPVEKSKSKALAATNYWTLEPSKFEHTMTLIGMVTADKLNVTAENFELGAFVGGAVRGSSPAIYVKSLNAYLFFITMYANKPGELINFKLYDGNNVRSLKETLYFSSDAQIGMVQEPQPFNLLTTTATTDRRLISYFEVMPNPLQNQAVFSFAAEQDGEARISVLDAVGATHGQWRINAQAGMNEFRWDARSALGTELASGVYFVKLDLDGKVALKKVILQR
jgi:hypothetical protein